MDLTRKDFIKSTGIIGASVVLGSCSKTQAEFDSAEGNLKQLDIRQFAEPFSQKTDLSGGELGISKKNWDTYNKTIAIKDLNLTAYANGANQEFRKEILNIHQMQGRKILYDDNVVFACGSMGLILASITALAQQTGADTVYAKAPYFHGLKKLVDTIPGLQFTSNPGDVDPAKAIQFLSVPNNPDGRSADPVIADHVILDRVYDDFASPPLDVEVKSPNIVIYSAKNYHMSALRFGYGFCRDKELGELIQEHVYSHTFGLPAIAQVLFPALVKDRKISDPEFYVRVAAEKIVRRKEFVAAFIKFNVRTDCKIEVKNKGDGNYLWLKAPGFNLASELDKIGVVGVPGEEFGDTNDFCRINLLADDANYQNALRKLQGI